MRAAVVCLALAGCRQVLGIPGEFQDSAYEVEVDVQGAAGASGPIALVVNDQAPVPVTEDRLTPVGVLGDGEDFTVTATGPCSVIDGSGTIMDAMNATGPIVKCDGLAGLGTMGFTAPAGLAFHGGNDWTMDASVLTQSTMFRPGASHAAPARVSGVMFDATQPIPDAEGYYGPVSLLDGAHAFHVVIDHLPEVTARDHIVTVEVGALAQVGYGKATQSAAGERYGASIAVAPAPRSEWLVVGVPDRAPGGGFEVFRRQGTTWIQAPVTPPATTPGARLGAAVAVSAGRMVIGAPGENAAYVYVFDGSVWGNPFQLTRPAGEDFGVAVAVAAGYAIVGAPRGNGQRGEVRAYERVGVTWNLHAAFTPALADPADRFGASVAGTETGWLAVGAPWEASSSDVASDDTYPGAGAVYPYHLSGGVWTPDGYLKAERPGIDDHLGAAVAIDDIGGTIYIAAGAPLEDSRATGIGGDPTDNSASAAGAVYVFQRTAAWARVAYVKADNAEAYDEFGSAVALVGTVLAVGAPYENSSARGIGGDQDDDAAIDAGAVYVYALVPATGTITANAYVKASNTGAEDYFGAGVALTKEALVVAAPLEDSGATSWNGPQGNGARDAGAVYVYR